VRGLEYGGPALFSVYTGLAQQELPAYLETAAAMQSRAFPAFSYDPSAGNDLASRFSLENNPQPEADWTSLPFEYADSDMQSVRRTIAFTYADFLLCDPCCQHHFMSAPTGFERARLLPAAEWIAAPDDSSDRVPHLVAVGRDQVLASMITDHRVIEAARGCLAAWHRLQELGGVHNSHAERVLAREHEKAAAAREKEASTSVQEAPVSPEVPSGREQPASAPAEEAAPERDPDQAYIETERCSTCNECTQLNNRMFAYNAEKQAYVADARAGSYAQLVEAAENCQLGIIHPGKPLNPAESGLQDLLKRAEAFL